MMLAWALASTSPVYSQHPLLPCPLLTQSLAQCQQYTSHSSRLCLHLHPAPLLK